MNKVIIYTERGKYGFFNEIMKFGDIFESQETIDELKDIADEIKKYDVYDVLARISGLNLMPHNQNKSVLLDSLIAGIMNITLRQSRLSGVARATFPDKQSHLVINYCIMF